MRSVIGKKYRGKVRAKKIDWSTRSETPATAFLISDYRVAARVAETSNSSYVSLGNPRTKYSPPRERQYMMSRGMMMKTRQKHHATRRAGGGREGLGEEKKNAGATVTRTTTKNELRQSDTCPALCYTLFLHGYSRRRVSVVPETGSPG